MASVNGQRKHKYAGQNTKPYFTACSKIVKKALKLGIVIFRTRTACTCTEFSKVYCLWIESIPFWLQNYSLQKNKKFKKEEKVQKEITLKKQYQEKPQRRLVFDLSKYNLTW